MGLWRNYSWKGFAAAFAKVFRIGMIIPLPAREYPGKAITGSKTEDSSDQSRFTMCLLTVFARPIF